MREFQWSDDGVEKHTDELETAESTEKELWVRASNPSPAGTTFTETLLLQTELLRVARTNFSEAFQVLVHLKIVRLFVESVLRYGLPAKYAGLVIKVGLFTILYASSCLRKRCGSRIRKPRNARYQSCPLNLLILPRGAKVRKPQRPRSKRRM